MSATDGTEPIDVTKTVYTVLDFLNWQRDGQLNLRPYFQRGNVWTSKAKSYLIDTLLRGYPIPVIYLQNQTDTRTLKNVRQVVDGQQRLRTILSFIDKASIPDAKDDDDIKILRAHNPLLAGSSFVTLPDDLKERLTSTEISVHLLPSRLPDKVLLGLFARLNSTGEKLNDQELRNAEYHGAFKALAYSLSYDHIELWKSWSLFPPRALTQMRDVEFVSELMLLTLKGLQSKSKASLDATYKKYDDEFHAGTEVETLINDVLVEIDEAITPDSRHKPLKRVLNQSWIYAIFAYVASDKSDQPLESGTWPVKAKPLTNASLRQALQTLEGRLAAESDLPDDVAKALRGASTDRSSRLSRIRFLAESF